MDQREIFERSRTRLIGHLKTEKNIALELDIKPQTLNSRTHYAKGICVKVNVDMYELLFKLRKIDSGFPGKTLLEGFFIVLEERLQQGSSSVKSALPSEAHLKNRDYFEKLKRGVAMWDEKVAAANCCTQKGQKSGLSISNSESFKQERHLFIIENQGLPGGKDKFYKAEKIRLEEREDLMEAFRTGVISMHGAYQLSFFNRERVAAKLAEGRGAVLAFLKAHRLAIKNKMKEAMRDDDIKREA